MNIIICGAGRVGFTIAKQLSDQGHSITVIDQSSEDIQKIDEALDVKAIVGKATYPSILEKAEAWEDKLSTMLVEYQTLVKKFEDCTTVWDLNILYEDYIGILLPQKQAIEMGRTISETDWDRKPEYEVDAYVFKF